jgi:hypothetical protein
MADQLANRGESIQTADLIEFLRVLFRDPVNLSLGRELKWCFRAFQWRFSAVSAPFSAFSWIQDAPWLQ